MYIFVSEDHILDWHSCQIYYPLEIKLLLLLYTVTANKPKFHRQTKANKTKKSCDAPKRKSTYAKVHDPHTNCLKCFPWCYWQSLWLDLININDYAKFYQNIPKGSRDRASFTFFSEFEPRQNLDLSQISFDNLIGYILSISMCMQNIITIFFTVLETGPFSLFQNLELGKASTDKNVISRSLGLDLVNINVYAKVYQNIPLSSRDRTIFTFSEFGTRQCLDRW